MIAYSTVHKPGILKKLSIDSEEEKSRKRSRLEKMGDKQPEVDR